MRGKGEGLRKNLKGCCVVMDKEAVSQLKRLTRFRFKRLENRLNELERLKKRVVVLERQYAEVSEVLETSDEIFDYLLNEYVVISFRLGLNVS